MTTRPKRSESHKRSKKRCADCGRTGHRVVARESNSSGQIGGRRCVCRKGCKAKKNG